LGRAVRRAQAALGESDGEPTGQWTGGGTPQPVGLANFNPNGMDFENRMTGGAISSPDPRMMAALPVGKPDYGLDELDLEAGNTVGSEAALAQAKAYIEAAEARA